MFAPGQSIVIREVSGGRTWSERRVTVIADDADELVTYFAAGTRWHHAAGAAHGETFIRMLIEGGWDLEEREFRPPGVLRIAPWGAPFDVALIWNTDNSVRGWYVNLQEPLRRTPDGVETLDEILDLVVSPDFQEVEWKDTEEVSLAVDLGYFTRDKAAQLRARAGEIERLVRSGQAPWNTAWASWLPS